jgi:hypothetical protein
VVRSFWTGIQSICIAVEEAEKTYKIGAQLQSYVQPLSLRLLRLPNKAFIRDEVRKAATDHLFYGTNVYGRKMLTEEAMPVLQTCRDVGKCLF